MRVLIADDHALFRESLRGLLETRDFEVVGEAGNGVETISQAKRLRPEMILLDLKMPGMDGLEACKRLSVEAPEIKIVVLTGIEDDNLLFAAIKAGAKGYLLKDLSSERFFALLEGVVRGEPGLTPALANKLLQEFAHPRKDPCALTEREEDVLQLMVSGVSTNKSLAGKMGVSENTVKFHVRNILEKLHLHSRTEVVAYALRNELVEPSECP